MLRKNLAWTGLRRGAGSIRSRRGVVALAAGSACAVLAVTACSSSSSSSASATSAGGSSSSLTTIRLSNTLIAGDEIPFVYGNAIGIWKKYGINLQVQNVSTAIQYTSLGAGQADVAMGSPGSIEAAVGGAPIKLIGQIGPDFIQLLAQKSVADVKGLKGTTLGSSAPGSVTAGIIKTYLAQEGLSTSDYSINYFSGSFPAVLTALISGKISATSAGYPYIAQATAANPGLHPVATISSDPIGILGGNEMSVNSTWAASNGPALKKFVAAWNAATKQSQANPQAAIAALAAATKTSTAVATTWFDKQSPLDGFFPLTQAQWNIIITSLKSQYPNVASASYSSLVDNSYVSSAS
ncbi:MAG TPA: ABC transporter substrate-binding protein [Trebonia sp.]|jgi:NitT/TauT family transport system substrate-binding protein